MFKLIIVVFVIARFSAAPFISRAEEKRNRCTILEEKLLHNSSLDAEKETSVLY